MGKKLTLAMVLMFASIAILLSAMLGAAESKSWESEEDFDEGIYEATGWSEDPGGVTLTGDEIYCKPTFWSHLSKGTSGTFDGGGIYTPSILHANGTFYLYYTAYNTSYEIALATSIRGYGSFSKQGIVLSLGGSGKWDDTRIDSPFVMYEDGLFKMWYYGEASTAKKGIGYATSPDGLTWTKYSGNPVLTPPSSGVGAAYIGHPCVVRIEGIYHMYMNMNATSNYVIGLATSTDGISWTYHNNNPVLDKAPSGEFGAQEVMHPSVVSDGAGYTMYYIGRVDASAKRRIGSAHSHDGITWERYPGIRVHSQGSQDEAHMGGIGAVWYNGFLWIFYQGEDSGGTLRILSVQLKPWFERVGTNPILANGTYDGTYLRDPCVIEDRTKKYFMYYLGYGKSPYNDYQVYRATSNSPEGPWTKIDGTTSPALGDVTSSWDDDLEGVCVLRSGSLYFMYFGGDSASTKPAIGIATDDDGTSFSRFGTNPILTSGTFREWDYGGVSDPWVLRVGDTYHMYYYGWYNDEKYGSIGHATSSDGFSWTKDPYNPVIVADPFRPIDDLTGWYNAKNPVVVHVNGMFKMYFSGSSMVDAAQQIMCVYSADGTNWTLDRRGSFLPLSIGFDSYWTQPGSVLLAGGREYLYYDGYSTGTSVGQIGLAYRNVTAGTYTSPVLDASAAWPVEWQSIDWDATVPSGCQVSFQVATNSGGSAWWFEGPEGSSSSYYTDPGQAIRPDQSGAFMRVKVFFRSSPGCTALPVLHSLRVNCRQRDSPSPPVVTLTSPNGGEDWMKTKEYPITWTAVGNLDTTCIDLYLSTDNGSSWSPIATGLANTGYYCWTVPNSETSGALIGLVATDIDGASADDVSDATFAIDPPPPKDGQFLTPATGEALTPGAREVSWAIWDPWGLADAPLTLEYTTDGGITWELVRDGFKLTDSTTWEVPELATSSDICQLRLSILNWLGDISVIESGVFTIDVEAPTISIGPLPEGLKAGKEFTLTAVAEDDVGVTRATLHISSPYGVRTMEMTPGEGGMWSADLSLLGEDEEVWVTASDGVHDVTSDVVEVDLSRSSGGSDGAAMSLAMEMVLVAMTCVMFVVVLYLVRSRTHPDRGLP